MPVSGRAVVVTLAIVVAAVAVGALSVSSQLDRAALFSPEGYAESGTPLGIQVGSSTADAAVVLNRFGLEQVDPAVPSACLGRQYQGVDVELWYDRSWRRGVICMTEDDNVVTSVAWYFNPLSP